MDVLVVGGSGYTGGELLRILSSHPKVDSIKTTSRKFEGKPVSAAHPNLKGIVDVEFSSYNPDDVGEDVVFLCLPHKTSMEYVGLLVEKDVKIVDLSADYRINDADLYEKYYCIHENPQLLEKAVYGLPELYASEIKKSVLVANPGCYATAAILGLLPLMVEEKLDLSKIVVDAKSGTSGAGVKPTDFLHASDVIDNLKPYKVTAHRHEPEIQHILNRINPNAVVNFTPTLAPFSRGMQETIHVFGDVEDVQSKYENYYLDKPFVRIVEDSFVKNVTYSNYVDIALFYDSEKKRVVVVSSIDNLIKGASGQAVQNMNLMLGYDETLGLNTPGFHP